MWMSINSIVIFSNGYYLYNCLQKAMASNTPIRSGSVTATIIQTAEERTPHPTLRLKLQPQAQASKSLVEKGWDFLQKGKDTNNQEPDKEDYLKECDQAKDQIIEDIKNELDANVEEMRTLLKSMKPTKDGKSEEEYAAEVAKFKQALEKIRGLMEEQSSFNRDLLNAVGNYLLESWEMMKSGAKPEDIKRFKEKTMNEMSGDYEKKTNEVKDKMKKEADINSGKPGPKDEMTKETSIL